MLYSCTFFLELVDDMEMVSHWEAWSEASLFLRLVEVWWSQQYLLQEDVWKQFVNDGEQTDFPAVLYVWHVALLMQQNIMVFCHAFGTWHSWRHLLKSQVRRLTMASPPSCRTPLVMLSSPGALLWSSFFIKSSTSVGRIMGTASSITSLCGCCGSIMSVGSLLDLYSSW